MSDKARALALLDYARILPINKGFVERKLAKLNPEDVEIARDEFGRSVSSYNTPPDEVVEDTVKNTPVRKPVKAKRR